MSNEDTSLEKPVTLEDTTPIITIPEEDIPEDNNEEIAPVIEPEPTPVIRKSKDSQVDELYYDDTTSNPLAAKERVAFPPADIEKIREAISNIDITEDEEVAKWATILESSMDKETFRRIYKKTLDSENRNFRQGIQFNGKLLSGSRPKVRETTDQVFKGTRALVSLMGYLGRGIHFNAPLWNTGIWVTFTAPAETELLELHRQLISDKIEFGRYTYGSTLSNQISYTIDRLVDFALSHMHSTTLKLPEDSEVTLKDIILAQDIPSLLWGMACATYPNGFQYSRACIDNPEKCNYVNEGALNLSKLQFTDDLSLTDAQKAHMSERQANTKSLEEVKAYQSQHTKSINKTVKVSSDTSKDISFTFKSPSITEYISSGYKWIQSMVDLIENSIVIPESDEEKNSFIRQSSKATTMRQYTHWVKEIEFGSNTINDKETIEKTLNFLSSDDILSKSFIEQVVDYIETSTIALIAIPNYTCPKCHKEQYESESHTPFFKELIPIDPIMVFTDLIVERISIIETR